MKRRVQPEVSTEGDSLLGDELEDAGAEEAPPAVDNAPEDAALPEEAGGREAPPWKKRELYRRRRGKTPASDKMQRLLFFSL